MYRRKSLKIENEFLKNGHSRKLELCKLKSDLLKSYPYSPLQKTLYLYLFFLIFLNIIYFYSIKNIIRFNQSDRFNQ
ncbi:hypothetical protein Hanom_Chr07g00589971 [Helianthus anomalus]